MANPTVDQALDVCYRELKKHTKDKRFANGVVKNMRARHYEYFKERFDESEDAWTHDEKFVRDSSQKVGRLARAISDTLKTATIHEDHVLYAVTIVGEHCKAFITRLRRRAARGGRPTLLKNYCPDE